MSCAANSPQHCKTVRTGQGRRKTNNRGVNREGRRAGRKPEAGLNQKNLEIFLDPWVRVDGILATFMKMYTVPGRRIANPEMIANAINEVGDWEGGWALLK